MNGRSWTAGLLLAAASCCPTTDAPKVATTPQATTTSAPIEARESPAQYVVRTPGRNTMTGTRFELERGQLGLIVRGERWVVDARGARVSAQQGPSLSRGEPLEEGSGSGYLFMGSAGLFTAPTFDGPLKELAVGDFRAVSQGPGFVLATREDGGVRAIDLATGKPRGGLPLGVVLVRTAKDGAAGAIAHGGRAYVSVDRGASWRDVTSDVGTPVGLEVSEGTLYFLDATGEAARLEGGSLVRAPAPLRPAPKQDPDWNKSESPLEYAMTRGALLDDGRAVAVDGGNIVEVSLGSGKIVAKEPGALPPQGGCVPQSVGAKILFLCAQSDTASVFSRSKKGGPLKLDKTFGLRGTFLRGRGEALLFLGPCKDSAPKAGVACARTRDGDWLELDRSADLSDAPANEPLRVITWVPREGGAYLLVGGKAGGLWDAKSGAKTRLDEDAQKKLEALFFTSISSSRPVSDRTAVDDQGAIVGLSKDNVGFRVSDGGKQVERSPFRFNQLASAGNLVLAFDSATGSLWQSSDWGWSYVEVDGPPDPTNTRDTPRTCSEAGCSFGQWLRLGWEPTPPTPKGPAKPSAGSLNAATPKLPQLKCSVSGKSTSKEVDPLEHRFGFGAEVVKRDGVYLALYPRSASGQSFGTLDANALRASITGKAAFFDTPLPPPSLLQSERKIRFVEPFDPKGTVRASSIKVSELFEAARLSGSPPPDLSQTDDRGLALSTLSDPPGVLLGSQNGQAGALLWARGKEKPIMMGVAQEPMTPMSAVQTGPEELAVLLSMWDSAVFVHSVGRGRSNELFSIPALPDSVGAPSQTDALALGPDNKVGVIRFQGDGPPSKDDPALLLRPNEAPVALAPWSTLELDGSPACAAMTGHRAIVQLRLPWLTPGLTNESWGREVPSHLRVRWSSTQVCLEAAELHASQHQAQNGMAYDVAMVARFGKEPSAGLVLVGEGAELREPRTCELVK